jgi:hypothetical protein
MLFSEHRLSFRWVLVLMIDRLSASNTESVLFVTGYFG